MSVSLSADSAPADPDDELLVAYLDGELQRSERTDLENRLLSDAPLRGRLTKLQSSWDMLDVLAVDGSGVSLVETTLELAIADVNSTASSKSHPQKQAKSQWLHWQATSVLMLCTLAGLVAWGISAYQSRQAYRSELSDLAIAQNLDAYNYGGDLELMRVLSSDPDWNQMVQTAAELAPANDAPQPLSQVSLNDRPAAITHMTVEQRERLGTRWDAFSRLSNDDQETIRRRAAEISSLPDHDLILTTMRSYATWRSRLPSGLVDRIESDDSDRRLQAIQDAIEVSKSSMAKTSGSQLDDETVDVIYFALQEFSRKRISKDERLYKPPGGFRGRMESPKVREYFVIRHLFGLTDRRSSDNRKSANSDRQGNRRDLSLSANELSTIKSLISDESLETLDILTGGDPTLASITLQVWVEEVIRRKMPFRGNKTPLETYQNFSDRERELVDLMPPEKMMEELSSGRPPRP